MKALSTRYLAQTGVIAALYAGFTIICMMYLGSFSFGPIQFRLSEALVVLALFTPAAIPGLTLGCVIANLSAIPLFGTGALGLLDVVFGSLATFLGAVLMRKLACRSLALSMLAPVITNMLIVPAYLPIILTATGFYTIPFTNLAVDDVYLYCYLFGVVSVGLGELVVLYLLGYPLTRALCASPYFQRMRDKQMA